MRKIEKLMLEAINTRKALFGRNTMVTIDCDEDAPSGEDRAHVYLHGNHIATYWYKGDILEVNRYTLANWPSVTTKSRLRALGADVYTKNHITYLNGQAVA